MCITNLDKITRCWISVNAKSIKFRTHEPRHDERIYLRVSFLRLVSIIDVIRNSISNTLLEVSHAYDWRSGKIEQCNRLFKFSRQSFSLLDTLHVFSLCLDSLLGRVHLNTTKIDERPTARENRENEAHSHFIHTQPSRRLWRVSRVGNGAERHGTWKRAVAWGAGDAEHEVLAVAASIATHEPTHTWSHPTRNPEIKHFVLYRVKEFEKTPRGSKSSSFEAKRGGTTAEWSSGRAFHWTNSRSVVGVHVRH